MDPSLDLIRIFWAVDWSFETLGAMVNMYVKAPAVDQMAKEGFYSPTTVSPRAFACKAERLSTLDSTHRDIKLCICGDRWPCTKMENGLIANTLYPLMVKAGYYVGFYGKYHHSI